MLKKYTKVLKFGLQNEHNWSIIGKILTEALKCLENLKICTDFRVLEVGGSATLAFDGFGGGSRIL